jgi:hypothetical protein
MLGTFGYNRKKNKIPQKKIHGHEWTGQKHKHYCESRVSNFPTTFNTTNITAALSAVDLWWHPHPRAPTALAHSPSAPSVRQANNFMFLSVVDTPTWRSKKCFFFFFLLSLFCVLQHGRVHHLQM